MRLMLNWAKACAMFGPLRNREAVFIPLVLLSLSLGGCTKCGWLWDQPTRSCHSDTPR